MSYPGQGAPRKSNKALPIIAAVIAGVLLIVGIRWFTTRDDPTTTGSGDTTTASAAQPPRDGCTAVTVAASSEKAALLNQMRRLQQHSGPHRRRPVLRRHGQLGRLRHRGGQPRRGLGRDTGRSGAGCVDPGRLHLGEPAAQRPDRQGPAEHRARRRSSRSRHLDPAGAGHAGADGQGAGLAGRPDRLVGRAGAGHRTRRAGRPRATRSGATSPSARPTPTCPRRAWRPPSARWSPPPGRPPT